MVEYVVQARYINRKLKLEKGMRTTYRFKIRHGEVPIHFGTPSCERSDKKESLAKD